MSDDNSTLSPFRAAVDQLAGEIAGAIESSQNKYNRALYDSVPDSTQRLILQNSYDNGMPVTKISKMTGVPESTIYSKITTGK
ncbi:sigma-70 RNA polymerase sigma factor region 4 domain-containing protein [Vibrio coralliirubri]|uniref:sigma-70 family RNA polymerase sigma factor n=1 Tax=Vibrio coralliirubri TaxID=1516159 RepID=UPI000632D3B5